MANLKSIEASIAKSTASHLVLNSSLHTESNFAQQFVNNTIEGVLERDKQIRNRFLAIFALGEVTDRNFRWTSSMEILRLEDKTMGPGSVAAVLQAEAGDYELRNPILTHFSFLPDKTEVIAPLAGFSAGTECYESKIARVQALLNARSFRPSSEISWLDEALSADFEAIGKAESTLELIEQSLAKPT